MLDQYDVFISYSHQDEEWVRDWLLPRLQAASLQVCIDFRDFDIGTPSLINMERAVERSRKTLIVLTPNWINSEWAEFESLLVGISDPAGRQRKLLPLMLEKSTLPARIRMLTYANFIVAERREAELQRLLSAFGVVQPSVHATRLPFVVFAMTEQEAKELVSKRVFEDPNASTGDLDRFMALASILEEHNLKDILEFYGQAREEWRPPIANQVMIQEIVKEIVGLINHYNLQSTPDTPIIQPQFFSMDFLSDDYQLRARTWSQLEQTGCVLMIDAISMFHPLLRQKLLLSGFGSKEQVSIVVLHPVSSDVLKINQLLEREIRAQMERAFYRFAEYFDTLCEFGIGNLRALKRSLFSILPATAANIQGLKPNPNAKERIRGQYGQPAGIQKVIFGGDGR